MGKEESFSERIARIKARGVRMVDIQPDPEHCVVCAREVHGKAGTVAIGETFETKDLYAHLCVRCVGWGARATWRAIAAGY